MAWYHLNEKTDEKLAFFNSLSTIGIRSRARDRLRTIMAKNLKMFFDSDGSPRARGPSSEKLLMAFLEEDVQGSDHICHDLMDDVTAIEDESAESREFIGNAHSVVITAEGVTIRCTIEDPDDEPDEAAATGASTGTDSDLPKLYETGLKHFREVLEDWEAFILDDQSPA